MKKNVAASVRERLLNISKKIHLEYQIILTRYFHERFLFRLATSPYKDNFCLKGGALMFAYEKFTARPTLDMDFSADKISNSLQSIHDAVTEICLIECAEDGVIFDANSISTETITEFKEYHGIRAHLVARLDSVRQRIAIDFGFGDTIVRPDGMLFDDGFGTNETMNRMWNAYLIKIKCSDNLKFNDVWDFIKNKLFQYITTV